MTKCGKLKNVKYKGKIITFIKRTKSSGGDVVYFINGKRIGYASDKKEAEDYAKKFIDKIIY